MQMPVNDILIQYAHLMVGMDEYQTFQSLLLAFKLPSAAYLLQK